MNRSGIATELRKFTGAGTITLTELTAFLGQKNVSRVKKIYLSDDPESEVPVMEAIGGKRYLIPEVAIRLKEAAK